MAFTFRIVFSGISAFVPSESFGDEETSLVTVLFPNALKPSLPAKTLCNPAELEARIVAPHYPILQFNRKNLQKKGNHQYPFFELNEGDNEKGIAKLVIQDIVVSPDGHPLGSGKVQLIDGDVRDPEHPTPEEEQYLRWLKKINEVLPNGPSTINPKFLGSLTPADKKDIVTRIRFSSGRLRTAKVSPDSFEFVPISGGAGLGAPQRLATSLALELEAEEKVKLVFRNFGSRDEPTRLVFGPDEDDPEEDVEIKLDNREPEGILGIEEDLINGVLIDPDFAVYYRLVQGLGNSQSLLVPSRVQGLSGTANGGGVGKPCSPLGIAAQ
jgi:hypothetical protein